MSEFHAIIEADHLKDYSNTLGAITEEATFHFTQEGVYTQPVDPANVAMINQTLHPKAFESYETDGFRTGISLTRLDDFLDAANKGDLVELELDPETLKLSIVMPDAEFTMACIDPDTVRNGQEIEDTEIFRDDGANLVVDVTMDAAAFKHSLSVVDKVTDHLVITANPERDNPVHFVGSGDTDDAIVRFGNSLHEGSKVHSEAEALYSLDYLKEFAGVMPKQVPVRVRGGTEWPILLEYSDVEGFREVRMMLAPRVDNS